MSMSSGMEKTLKVCTQTLNSSCNYTWDLKITLKNLHSNAGYAD